MHVQAACDNGVLKCTHVPYIHDQVRGSVSTSFAGAQLQTSPQHSCLSAPQLTGRRTASGTCQEDLYLQAKGELDQLTSYDVQLVDRSAGQLHEG